MIELDLSLFRMKSPYLDFEWDYIAVEDERWKESRSEEDRLACLHKRIEAKAKWEEMGNVVPHHIKFSTI